jgi:hypothetical protein
VTAAVVFREQPIAEASHDQDKDDSQEERHNSTYRPFSRFRQQRPLRPDQPTLRACEHRPLVLPLLRLLGWRRAGLAVRAPIPRICGSLRPSGPVRRHLMAAGSRALMGWDEAWQSQRCHSRSGAGVFDAGSNLNAWTTSYGALAAALNARYASRISSPAWCILSSSSNGRCTFV